MTKIYIASMKWSQPALAEAELVKETPKQFHIGEWRDIIGKQYYLPTRIGKDDYPVFRTKGEALVWIRSALRERLRKIRNEVVQTQVEIDVIDKLIEQEPLP